MQRLGGMKGSAGLCGLFTLNLIEMTDQEKLCNEVLSENKSPLEGSTNEHGGYTKEQFDYVMSVPDIYLRSHLLHQIRLRDNASADRDAFEFLYNNLLIKSRLA